MSSELGALTGLNCEPDHCGTLDVAGLLKEATWSTPTCQHRMVLQWTPRGALFELGSIWSSPNRQPRMPSNLPSKGALFELGAHWSSNCEPNLLAQRVNCLAVGKGQTACLSGEGAACRLLHRRNHTFKMHLAGGTLWSSECGQHRSCVL